MRQYSRGFLISILGVLMFLTISSVNLLKVNATTLNTLNPTEYETYLNSTVNSSSYYDDFATVMKQYFPSMNISPDQFENLVAGKKSYTILEIVPNSASVDDSSAFSKISDTVDTIKAIYQRTVLRNNLTGKDFITNMPNFSVETMTIKQFVDDQSQDFDGKYDAIIFDSGDYTVKQVESCVYNYDLTGTTYVQNYDQNHRLTFAGYIRNNNKYGYGQIYDQNGRLTYAGEWKDGKYNGDFGQLYDQNGRLTYAGGWKDGQKECYGEYYDQNGILRYMGYWHQDQYNGYGMSWDQNGRFLYQGYFSNGTYQGSNGLANSEVLNDITSNKANLIITDYIQKGLPVFISNSSISDSSSNLYQYFHNLNYTYSNVYLFEDTNDTPLTNNNFYHALSVMGITELVSQKPAIEIINQPIQFSDNADYTYKSNDSLNFTVDLLNRDQAILLYYIDVDQNGVLDDDEMAYAKTIVKGENSFSYKLPTLYNGLLSYQIVVKDNDFKQAYSGQIHIKNDVVQTINVLNIVSDDVYNKNDLFNDQLYQAYFQNNGDYKINIDSCKVKDFLKNNTKWECSHNQVMDNYDVIFFGQDIFDQPFNNTAYSSIKEQLNNGKPMVFSSSVTKGNAKWVDYYTDELSLSNYRTDLYKLANNVDKLKVVNQSSYVLYPFNINNEQLNVPSDLNYAFNEAYQLDLESPDLVPLMNMYNSTDVTYDRYDSYNDFYYYKNDNVVYLNIGNNSYTQYKDLEHKLLADAIVNLYVQDKGKTATLQDLTYIDASNTFENALIDVNDSISFDFSVFHSTSETYDYKLYLNDTLIDHSSITNNQVVHVSLSDLASPENNMVDESYVYVLVKDSKGVQQTYGFNVFVGNFSTYNMQFKQSVTSIVQDKYIEVNKANKYALQYQLTLRPIDVSYLDTRYLPSSFTLHNVQFSEIIPTGVVVDNSANYFTLSTNNLGQTVLTKVIPNITYALVDDTYVPTVGSVSFNVPIIANSTGEYSITNAGFTYFGIGSEQDSYSYSELGFTAIKAIDSSMVTAKFGDYLFIDGTFIDDVSKMFTINSDTKTTSINFSLLNTTDGDPVSHLVLSNYTLETNKNIDGSLNVGSQNMQIIVTDIFGNVVRKTFEVRTYVPIGSIDLKESIIDVGDTDIPLRLTVTPSINLDSIQLSVSQANQNIVSITRVGNAYYLTGLNPGYVDITATGYDFSGNQISISNMVVVNQKLDITFTNPMHTMFIDETYDYSDIINNISLEKFNYSDITFTSTDPDIVIIDNNKNIVATGAGQAIVRATLPNGSSAQILIKVYDYLSPTESGFDSKVLSNTLVSEQNYNLVNFVQIVPNTINTNDVTMTFELISAPDNFFEYFNDAAHPYQFKVVPGQSGQITIRVTLDQYKNDVIVRTVTKDITLTINLRVDPVEDSGNNSY